MRSIVGMAAEGGAACRREAIEHIAHLKLRNIHCDIMAVGRLAFATAALLCATANAASSPQDPELIDTQPADSMALGDSASRMTVPVSIGGSAPYPFIIDTGAERSVVSRQLAGILRLERGPDIRMVSMSGNTAAATVRVPSLAMGPVHDDRPFMAPALDAQHLGAHGLLGIEQLRDRRVSIDFETGLIGVRPSSRRTALRAGRDEIMVAARSKFGQLIVTEAMYEDTPIRVVIDTGSQITLGNSALRRRLGKRAGIAGTIAFSSVTGAVIEAPYSFAERVSVGGIGLEKLPVAFTDVAPFAHFGLTKKPALLLGMDALRAFRRIDIDFPNRQIRFTLPKR